MTKQRSTPAQPQKAPHPEPLHDKIGLERLIFFSDAVFAIAITLLALEIRLDTNAQTLNDAELLHQLLLIWRKYLSYVISFLVLGLFWVAHHRKFRFIQRYDRVLIWLNLLMMMVVAFVPFPTSILSQYGNRTATIFYALSVSMGGIVSGVMWWYAAFHAHLTDPTLDARQLRLETWLPVASSGVFLASIGLSFIDADLAKFSWLLIVPVTILLR